MAEGPKCVHKRLPLSPGLTPQIGNAIPVNVIMFAPAMLLGLIGGILGAIFTITNLKISRLRRRLLAKVHSASLQKLLRFMEPPFIMVSHCENGESLREWGVTAKNS
jgi:hypothetical protein